MDKTLDQAEIDSMFAAAGGGTSPILAAVSAPQAFERYDFGRSGQITREQMQGISAVNDLFARNLTHSVGAWLRSRFDVALVSAEQMTWSEFTSLISEPAFLCSATLAPLAALAALQLDLALAPAVVDLLLGGAGRGAPLREPTEIEESILISMFEILLRELNSVWHSAGLVLTLGKRERDAQISHLMSSSEKILCVSFEVRMAEVQGSLNLCLPSVVLSTLLRRPVDTRPRQRSSDARAHLQQRLMGAAFDSSLQFPPVRLNAHALAELLPGKVLSLPLPRQASAELYIAGRPLFEAIPVRLGDDRAAQLNSYLAIHPV